MNSRTQKRKYSFYEQTDSETQETKVKKREKKTIDSFIENKNKPKSTYLTMPWIKDGSSDFIHYRDSMDQEISSPKFVITPMPDVYQPAQRENEEMGYDGDLDNSDREDYLPRP